MITKSTLDKIPISESYSPPCIANTIKGKFGIVAGKWYLVDDSITTGDLMTRWRHFDLYKLGVKEWQVAGSRGNKYTVKNKGKEWSCTCTGFKFHGKCKHIKSIQENV